MKRRIFALLAVAVLMLSLAACGGDSAGNSNNPPTESSVEDGNGQQNKAPEQEPEEAPQVSDNGTLGDYVVEIKDAKLAKDYEGSPVIVITYAWTNNSGETTSAMASMIEKAFQDGVQLDTAIVADADVYDSDASMKDVRPGTTIDVQCAYVMTSETSIVEFEVSEFLSFSKEFIGAEFDPSTL